MEGARKARAQKSIDMAISRANPNTARAPCAPRVLPDLRGDQMRRTPNRLNGGGDKAWPDHAAGHLTPEPAPEINGSATISVGMAANAGTSRCGSVFTDWSPA